MRFVVVVLFAGLGVAAAPPAMAGNPGTSVAGVDGIKIFAQVQYGAPPGKNGVDRHGCDWTAVGERNDVDTLELNGVTYIKFVRSCPTRTDTLWIPQLSPTILGAHAVNRVERLLPQPEVGIGGYLGDIIVDEPVWYWTAPGDYRTFTAHAWLPAPSGGVISATASATPTRLSFTPGEPDSHSVACAGPGTMFDLERRDRLPTDCTYTYFHSSEISDTETFPATLTIDWRISWRATNNRGATLPTHTTTTTTDIIVGEIQAIIVDNPG